MPAGELIRLVVLALWSMGAPLRDAPMPERVPAVEPMTLAFYYPWYGSPDGPSGGWVHWEGVDTEARTIASSPNYPLLGPYDSLDPAVIARHMEWIRGAGMDGLIVSWWGTGTHEDRAVPAILEGAARAGLRVSLYIERTPADSAGPAAAEATAAMLLDVADRYASHPAFLRVGTAADARPVLFTYVRMNQQLTNRGWNAVLNRLEIAGREGGGPAPRIIADRPPEPIRSHFDGWHTYDPMGQIFHERDRHADLGAWARRAFGAWVEQGRATGGGITCVTVCPGYDDRYFREPGVHVPRDGGETYRTLWREAIAAEPDWILITSFNEWHETSEIEPSDRHGTRYLEITREMTARWRTGD